MKGEKETGEVDKGGGGTGGGIWALYNIKAAVLMPAKEEEEEEEELKGTKWRLYILHCSLRVGFKIKN